MTYIKKFILQHDNLHIWASKIRHVLTRLWMRICRIYPIQKNKIIFVNYYGSGFGDNGKAISQKLLEVSDHLDLVWAVRDELKDSVPFPLRTVTYRSLSYYKEMATSRIWLDNSRKGCDLLKREGQYYIQLWHGMYPLKKIERDAEDSLAESYIADAKYDSRMVDVLLSGCGYFMNICQHSFWYDGEIMKCGTPRLDCLFDNLEILQKNARRKIGIPNDKKIVLYAPTFRANHNMECYHLNFEGVLCLLKKVTGNDWVFAVRLHPNVADKADFITYNDKIYNATVYPDLYELFSIVDIVITDYSSVMFESGIFEKPVFLFATDIETYVKDRNFYFDLKKLPFPLAESNEDLYGLIKNFSYPQYLQRLREFNESLDLYEDGKGSDCVAKRILEVVGK